MTIGDFDRNNGRRLSVDVRLDLADFIVERQVQRDLSATRVHDWLKKRLRGSSPPQAYSRELVKVISILPQLQRLPLEELMLGFKAEAQRSATKVFSLTSFSHEEVARTLLLFYLRPRGYAEARLGAGRGDIVIPNPSAVIETKIARTREDVHTGLSQTSKYLDAERRPGTVPVGYLVLVVADSLPSFAGEFSPRVEIRGWNVSLVWVVIPTEYPSTRGRRLARAQSRPRAARAKRRASSAA